MQPLARDEILAALGPVDDHLVAEVLATGASREELALAEAWFTNDEAPMNAGDSLASGRIARIVELLQAAEDSSHKTPSATSFGTPARCIGIVGMSRCRRPGSPLAACNSVAMSPGATAFTRIPSVATSRARPMVKLSIAPFDAA